MSNKVKYYDTALHSGFTVGNFALAGSLLTPFDLALYAGFNQVNVSSITRSGSIVTVTTATNHNYLHNQVILIAGAVETDYNGEFSITKTSDTTFTYTIATTPTTPATGTITAKVAPLGWEKPYSGTNKAVYRSPNTSGSRHYFRLDDSNATISWDRGWDGRAVAYTGIYAMRCGIFSSMSDVDTGNEEGKVMFVRGSNTSGNRLIIVGDDTTLYWALLYTGSYNWFGYGGMGDYLPWNGHSTVKPSFAMGNHHASSNGHAMWYNDNPLSNQGLMGYVSTAGGNYPGTGLVLGQTVCQSRPEVGLGSEGSRLALGWRVGGFTGQWGTTGLAEMGTGTSLNSNTMGTNWFTPVYIGYMWPLYQMIGEMPGLVDCLNGRVVIGNASQPEMNTPIQRYRAADGSDRRLLGIHVGGTERRGQIGIDITGPWR